jgi:hypothetical protein
MRNQLIFSIILAIGCNFSLCSQIASYASLGAIHRGQNASSGGEYISLSHTQTYKNHISSMQKLLRNRSKDQKIVLKRSPALSHCVRPHSYKQGPEVLQLDVSALHGVMKLEYISLSLLPKHLQAIYKQYSSLAVASVQCLTSMEELVDHLLPYGFIPAVVPEFKGITVGKIKKNGLFIVS